MSYTLHALFSYSICLGALAGCLRYKKADPAFLPFIFLIWAGTANEIASEVLIRSGYSNAIANNFYYLAEGGLLVWQFKRWGLFGSHYQGYYLLAGLLLAGWTGEQFLWSDLYAFSSYFIIGYSFVMVFLAINAINRLIVSEPGPLLSNAVFLICTALAASFTYAGLVESFWLYGLNKSKLFRVHILELFSIINLITNLIYALAILWIPMKPRYILPS